MMLSQRVLLVQTREIASVSLVNRMIAQGLVDAGHRVEFLYLETGEGAADLGALHNLLLRKQDYSGLRLAARRKLKAFFREHQFDWVIANMFKTVELLGSLQSHLGQARCLGVFAAFGEFDRWKRRVAFRLFNKDRFSFVAASQVLCDYLIAQRVGMTAANTRCIAHALDIAALDERRLSPSAARVALGLAEDKRWIGTIGRLVADKQQDALIRAFALISHQHPQVNLAIIGEGEARATLAALIAHLGLEGRVQLVGARAQAVNYLGAFTCFAFPSKSEGFGLALLEAMAAGSVIISNNIEPLASILGDTGYCVNVADTPAFAAGLHECLQFECAARAQLGAKARARVASAYDVAQFHQSYCRLIEGATS